MSGAPTERLRDLGERVERTVLETVGRAASRVQEHKPLSADLLENDDAYLAVFDAAGATAGDVDVRFDDNTLFVRIDRFREFYEGFEMRVPGRGLSLEGSVEFPPEARVEPREATATVTDTGVLHVRVPKAESGNATQVTVSDAENGNGNGNDTDNDREPGGGSDVDVDDDTE